MYLMQSCWEYFTNTTTSLPPSPISSPPPMTPSPDPSPSDYFVKCPPLSEKERLNLIFNQLLLNEGFKDVWERVNQNLHYHIQVLPGSTRKELDSTVPAMQCAVKCGVNCKRKNENVIHSYNFYIIATPDRSDRDIQCSLIFEACNTARQPEYLELNKALKARKITCEQYALETEKLEWESLKDARTIENQIYPVSSDSSKKPIPDFARFLARQKDIGHYQRYLSQN